PSRMGCWASNERPAPGVPAVLGRGRTRDARRGSPATASSRRARHERGVCARSVATPAARALVITPPSHLREHDGRARDDGAAAVGVHRVLRDASKTPRPRKGPTRRERPIGACRSHLTGRDTVAKLPKGLYQRGSIFWTKVYQHGKAIYESTRTDNLTKAKAILDVRRGAAQQGEAVLPSVDRVQWKEVKDDLIA